MLEGDMREYCLRLSNLAINRRLYSVAEKSWFDNTTLKVYLHHIDEATQKHTPLSASAIARFRKIELYIYESHNEECPSDRGQCLEQYFKRIQDILSTLAQQPQSKTKPRTLDVFLTSQGYLQEYHLKRVLHDYQVKLLHILDSVGVDWNRADFDSFADGEYEILKQMVETRFAVYEDEAFKLGGGVDNDLDFRRKVLASLRNLHESKAVITRAARVPLVCAYTWECTGLLYERLYGPDLWDKWAHHVPDKKLRCACRLHPGETEENHPLRCSYHTFEQWAAPDAEDDDPTYSLVRVERDWYLTQTLVYLQRRAMWFQNGRDGYKMDVKPIIIAPAYQSPTTLLRRIRQRMIDDEAPFFLWRRQMEECRRRRREAGEDDEDENEEMDSDEEEEEDESEDDEAEMGED